MAKGDELQGRLINFAVSIIKLSSKLTKTAAEKHIARQILRSGTSAAPNFAEARSAESQSDFIHKLKIGLKELNETRIWIQMIIGSQMILDDELLKTKRECEELCRIMNASVCTAMRNKR